jgi:putative ABC transport system substrate-binding protein
MLSHYQCPELYQESGMKRRDFIIVLAGARGGWPSPARAQQKAMPVIGYLAIATPASNALLLPAFLRGLGETGYVERQNVVIEYRWAEDRYDRLPAWPLISSPAMST